VIDYMLFRRKMRPAQELQNDPNFPFRVGRLVSAAEHVCHYMLVHGDENAQAIARHAHKSIDYFLDESERHSTEFAEEDTLILPPVQKEV
jgi:hypothetical protein